MRLIDADALIAYCDEKWIPLNVDEARKLESVITGRDKPIPVAEAFMSVIEKQPTVELRAKGKWDFIGDNMFMCTSCGAIYTVQQLECLKQHVTDLYIPPYCPNCGADMRGEEE